MRMANQAVQLAFWLLIRRNQVVISTYQGLRDLGFQLASQGSAPLVGGGFPQIIAHLAATPIAIALGIFVGLGNYKRHKVTQTVFLRAKALRGNSPCHTPCQSMP
jgi:hypothetical protein